MADPVRLLTLQFLDWLALSPRSYGEVMDAWRTSCPRLPVWEDAVDLDLVRIEHLPGRAMADCAVTLTGAGLAALATAAVEA